MTIEYEFSGDISDLSELQAAELEDKLYKSPYEFYFIGNRVDIVGECDVDSYDHDADDVSNDIIWLVGDYVDLDGRACEINCEPDWDKMTGGYDDCLDRYLNG